MKKILPVIILIFTSIFSYAQQMELSLSGFVDKSDNTKNFVVIDIPNTTKEVLYNRAKKYINTIYNNPDFVSSQIENEQIVIDAIESEGKMVIFRLSGNNIWSLNYKYELLFKDNKVKFSPSFKYLTNPDDAVKINLVGFGVMGDATGIYNKKGKVLREKAKVNIDNSVNDFIKELTEKLVNANSKDSDW